MPKIALSQNNFNGGEYGQGLRLRSNLAIYNRGSEKMVNWIPINEGCLKFRVGLNYNRETKNSNETRLINFISSENERYILEFSNLVLRVYKDDVQIGTDIVSPYRTQDLPNIQYAQEKSIMILVDGTHHQYRLISGTTFTLNPEISDYDIDESVPMFRSENLNTQTMTPSATTGNITIDSSIDYFEDDIDLHRYIKIRDAGTGQFGIARITAVNTTKQVNATVVKAFPGTSAYSTWSISVIPNAVTFFEQRLIYGEFNKVGFSKIPDDNGIVRYNDFTIGTSAEDGIVYESGLLRGNIQWLVATERIIAIGTYTGIFRTSSSNLEESISPANPPSVKKISSIVGTTNVQPIQSNNAVFFLSRDKRRLLSLGYNYDAVAYQIQDVTLLSKEMNNEGIVELAYESGDSDYIFCVKSNGDVSVMIYNEQQSILGWTLFKTDGVVESVATVPDINGKDRVYFVVNRTINGSTKRYIELLSNDVVLPKEIDYYTGDSTEDRQSFLFNSWETLKDINYLDCSKFYDGSLQTETITPSAVTGNNISFNASGNMFASSDIGRQIWEKSSDGRAVITQYVSQDEVKCNILSDFESTDPLEIGDWYLTSNVFTGLDYLEGKEVGIIRDGGRDEQKYTVTGGSITISQQASKCTVGLSYEALFKSVALQGGSANGSSEAKTKLVNKLGIYFLNSVDVKIGTDLYNLETVLFGVSEIMGRAITPYTGFKKINISDVYTKEKHIYLLKDSPTPCIIQSITALMETNSE